MTRLVLSLLLTVSIIGTDLFAQVFPRVLPARVEDAIRFGNTEPLGTARFMGTGGSMTSIGVDYTTLHTNPAGIGWNRYSSVQLTGGFVTAPTKATLLGNFGNQEISDSRPRPTIPSFGVVYAQPTRSVDWSTFNIGVGVTRLADFNETISYDGFSEGSIIDAIVEDLNDNFSDPFRTDLIFDIDPSVSSIPLPLDQDGRAILNDGSYYSDFDLEENLGGKIRRTGTVERSGSLNEFAIGAGGNYKEKFLWGITLGIPFINFTETKVYDEVDERDEITSFDDAGFDETLEMTGSGVNFKFGAIYLPSPKTRISAAVHSPTFWTIDETYFTTLEYNYTIDGVAQGGTGLSPRSEAAINLQTPWKFMLGAGYLVGSKGFVSFDADYSNYAGSSFSFADFSEADEVTNEDIDNTLGSSIGVRLGGEVNVKPFQVRAGVGYRTIPNLDIRNDEAGGTTSVSIGAGWSKGKIFVDAALRADVYSGYYAPYKTFAFDSNVVTTNRTRMQALVTVGYRGF